MINQIKCRYIALLLLLSGFALTVHCAEEKTLPGPILDYYGETGCAHCDLFASKILPSAERASGIKAEAVYYDILSTDGYDRCVRELSRRGLVFSVFPVLIIGSNVYQGNAAVETNLPLELEYFARHGTYRTAIADGKQPDAGSVFRPAFIPVLLAGLVDGINPCAFATMLFFISWIHLRGGGRKRLLLTGVAFISGVFAAYLAIGFGLLSFFRTTETIALVRPIVRYLFTALSLIFALLSARDAVLLFRGENASRLALQLPKGIKRMIHRVIRKREGKGETFPPLIFASFALTGIIVAVLELACTGQIYFPTIAYMVQSGGNGAVPLFWLLLYNAAFILPLGGVFIIVFAGVEQQRVSAWFSSHLAGGKIAIALLFAFLSALIWFSGF